MTFPPVDLDRLREIGWEYWDPLDIKHHLNSDLVQPPLDEYDDYLILVVLKLIKGQPRERIAEYLQYVLMEPDDEDQTDEFKVGCKQAVEEIDKYLIELEDRKNAE